MHEENIRVTIQNFCSGKAPAYLLFQNTENELNGFERNAADLKRPTILTKDERNTFSGSFCGLCCGGRNKNLSDEVLNPTATESTTPAQATHHLDVFSVVSSILNALPSKNKRDSNLYIMWSAAMIINNRCIDLFSQETWDHTFRPYPTLSILDCTFIPFYNTKTKANSNKCSDAEIALALLRYALSMASFFTSNQRQKNVTVCLGGILNITNDNFSNLPGLGFDNLILQFHCYRSPPHPHFSSMTVMFLDENGLAHYNDFMNQTISLMTEKPNSRNNNINENISPTSATTIMNTELNKKITQLKLLSKISKFYTSYILNELFQASLHPDSNLLICTPVIRYPNELKSSSRSFIQGDSYIDPGAITVTNVLEQKTNLPDSMWLILKQLPQPKPDSLGPTIACPSPWQIIPSANPSFASTLSQVTDCCRLPSGGTTKSPATSTAMMRGSVSSTPSHYYLETLSTDFPRESSISGFYLDLRDGENRLDNQGWDRRGAVQPTVSFLLPCNVGELCSVIVSNNEVSLSVPNPTTSSVPVWVNGRVITQELWSEKLSPLDIIVIGSLRYCFRLRRRMAGAWSGGRQSFAPTIDTLYKDEDSKVDPSKMAMQEVPSESRLKDIQQAAEQIYHGTLNSADYRLNRVTVTTEQMTRLKPSAAEVVLSSINPSTSSSPPSHHVNPNSKNNRRFVHRVWTSAEESFASIMALEIIAWGHWLGCDVTAIWEVMEDPTQSRSLVHRGRGRGRGPAGRNSSASVRVSSATVVERKGLRFTFCVTPTTSAIHAATMRPKYTFYPDHMEPFPAPVPTVGSSDSPGKEAMFDSPPKPPPASNKSEAMSEYKLFEVLCPTVSALIVLLHSLVTVGMRTTEAVAAAWEVFSQSSMVNMAAGARNDSEDNVSGISAQKKKKKGMGSKKSSSEGAGLLPLRDGNRASAVTRKPSSLPLNTSYDSLSKSLLLMKEEGMDRKRWLRRAARIILKYGLIRVNSDTVGGGRGDSPLNRSPLQVISQHKHVNDVTRKDIEEDDEKPSETKLDRGLNVRGEVNGKISESGMRRVYLFLSSNWSVVDDRDSKIRENLISATMQSIVALNLYHAIIPIHSKNDIIVTYVDRTDFHDPLLQIEDVISWCLPNLDLRSLRAEKLQRKQNNPRSHRASLESVCSFDSISSISEISSSTLISASSSLFGKKSVRFHSNVTAGVNTKLNFNEESNDVAQKSLVENGKILSPPLTSSPSLTCSTGLGDKIDVSKFYGSQQPQLQPQPPELMAPATPPSEGRPEAAAIAEKQLKSTPPANDTHTPHTSTPGRNHEWMKNALLSEDIFVKITDETPQKLSTIPLPPLHSKLETAVPLKSETSPGETSTTKSTRDDSNPSQESIQNSEKNGNLSELNTYVRRESVCKELIQHPKYRDAKSKYNPSGSYDSFRERPHTAQESSSENSSLVSVNRVDGRELFEASRARSEDSGMAMSTLTDYTHANILASQALVESSSSANANSVEHSKISASTSIHHSPSTTSNLPPLPPSSSDSSHNIYKSGKRSKSFLDAVGVLDALAGQLQQYEDNVSQSSNRSRSSIHHEIHRTDSSYSILSSASKTPNIGARELGKLLRKKEIVMKTRALSLWNKFVIQENESKQTIFLKNKGDDNESEISFIAATVDSDNDFELSRDSNFSHDHIIPTILSLPLNGSYLTIEQPAIFSTPPRGNEVKVDSPASNESLSNEIDVEEKALHPNDISNFPINTTLDSDLFLQLEFPEQKNEHIHQSPSVLPTVALPLSDDEGKGNRVSPAEKKWKPPPISTTLTSPRNKLDDLLVIEGATFVEEVDEPWTGRSAVTNGGEKFTGNFSFATTSAYIANGSERSSPTNSPQKWTYQNPGKAWRKRFGSLASTSMYSKRPSVMIKSSKQMSHSESENSNSAASSANSSPTKAKSEPGLVEYVQNLKASIKSNTSDGKAVTHEKITPSGSASHKGGSEELGDDADSVNTMTSSVYSEKTEYKGKFISSGDAFDGSGLVRVRKARSAMTTEELLNDGGTDYDDTHSHHMGRSASMFQNMAYSGTPLSSTDNRPKSLTLPHVQSLSSAQMNQQSHSMYGDNKAKTLGPSMVFSAPAINHQHGSRSDFGVGAFSRSRDNDDGYDFDFDAVSVASTVISTASHRREFGAEKEEVMEAMIIKPNEGNFWKMMAYYTGKQVGKNKVTVPSESELSSRRYSRRLLAPESLFKMLQEFGLIPSHCSKNTLSASISSVMERSKKSKNATGSATDLLTFNEVKKILVKVVLKSFKEEEKVQSSREKIITKATLFINTLNTSSGRKALVRHQVVQFYVDERPARLKVSGNDHLESVAPRSPPTDQVVSAERSAPVKHTSPTLKPPPMIARILSEEKTLPQPKSAKGSPEKNKKAPSLGDIPVSRSQILRKLQFESSDTVSFDV